MRFDADTDIQFVKQVGEKRAKLFNKLGVYTVGQLLQLYPRNYIDFSYCVMIKDAMNGVPCCIKAVVDTAPQPIQIRKGMTIYKTLATDGESVMEIVIFNNRFLASSLKGGGEYCFYGKLSHGLRYPQMDSPVVERADCSPGFRPVYPLTAGLSSRTVAAVMKNALLLYYNSGEQDALPMWIRREYKLCSKRFAYFNIHFPSCEADARAAKKRLIFEELLMLQLGMSRMHTAVEKSDHVLEADEKDDFLRALPFTPTHAQVRAVTECVDDMRSGRQMNRLLQGDVGSGKTAVAAAVMYCAARGGMQCAMMAPTEILAHQHYATLCGFLEPFGLKVALLTADISAKEKRKTKMSLLLGEIDIVVGTHALLQDDVRFCRLGLVITDEQHRFGVSQRGVLSEKGGKPHVLVMSATPIPRTLALIVYGDLDISVLDTLPAGRQKISTYCVDSSYRGRIYTYVKKHLDKGLQAYIVCPLVSDSVGLPLASAEEYYDRLSQREFADYKVGLLHGKMKAAEKEAVMRGFCDGEIQLLICTTVIEVGVDVPNAVVMVIENAERFGLSQLHQLRGRVGRGQEKSSCILITDGKGEQTAKRTSIMCKTNNGFLIAEEDLRQRGPGDFFGSRQHGLPALHIADMMEDTEILQQAQQAAGELLQADRELLSQENAALRAEIKKLFGGYALI